MFLFKKKITIFDYCDEKFDLITSQEKEKNWIQLLEYCKDPVLDMIDKELYCENLRAVNLQLIGIGLANIDIDIRFEMLELWTAFYKANKFYELDRLNIEYNKAFGLSSTDGIRLMTELFFKNISNNPSEILTKTFEIYYTAFYTWLKAIFDEHKKIKLTL